MFSAAEAHLPGRLPPGGMRIFMARIPPDTLDNDVFERLTAEERLATRSMSPQRRAQFALGRTLLSHTADGVFGPAGYSVRLADGRPVIAAAGGGPAAASISHSADVVVCATARLHALGIDVERIRPRRSWERLAQEVLHPAELASMRTRPEDARWAHFYAAWT